MSVTPADGLRRDLGLLETLSIVIGRIIGSGIFRTPGVVLLIVAGLNSDLDYSREQIPGTQLSVGLFFLVWILGGFATLLGALCYAELVAMLPRSGGPYAYLRAAYPEWWTFLRGWAMFFVSETAAIVGVSIVFAEYGNVLWTAVYGAAYSKTTTTLIALALIWGLTFANSFGVFLSGVMQNIFSGLKLFALLTIVAVCFSADGQAGVFTNQLWPEAWTFATMIAAGEALRYVFFAYSGWEGATYVAEEVRNPRRNLPLSLLFGIGGVMIVYLMVNAAYLYQLGAADAIVAKRGIAAAAMNSAVGAIGGAVIAGIVLLSAFGNVSTQIMVKARTWHAMARDGLFFEPVAKVSERYHTPNRAMWFQAGWASMLLAWSSSSGNSYEALIDFFSFTSAVFNISTFAAVWVLRRKMKDAERPFKTPLFPITLGLTLLIHAWFMAVTLYDAPLQSLAGVALTLTGFAYYYRIAAPRVATRRAAGEQI